MSGADATAVDESGWIRQALQTPAESRVHTVDGVGVVCREWGRGNPASVVLVHGSAANSHWWDHIGPVLALNKHVVAVDMSGHGDSAHHADYSQQRWAEQLDAIVHHVALPNPVLVAHSMGGKVAYRAAASGLDRDLSGLAVLDANIAGPVPADAAASVRARGLRTPKIYADKASAIEAFRPFRSTGLPFPDLIRHIGLHSIKPTEGGWTWKFDPKTFIAATQPPPAITPLRCPIAVLRAEHGSVISNTGAEALIAGLGATARFDVLTGAGHHMLLDSPRSVTAHILGLLDDWG